MGFKVVHTYALPGVDHGDALLESLDAALFKGVWLNEDEIISNTKDADAIIGVVSRQPFNRRVFKTLRNCRIIAGAGIDVTVEEPIAADNPLIKMPNVILTGHSAFYSTTSDAELFYKPMTQVAMALRGEWPLYGLNPEVKETWLQRWGTAA